VINGTIFAFIPLILSVLVLYAFFSIAIDVRAIRRSLERQGPTRNQGS
jgi:hypothetical protein